MLSGFENEINLKTQLHVSRDEMIKTMTSDVAFREILWVLWYDVQKQMLKIQEQTLKALYDTCALRAKGPYVLAP